MQRGRPRPAPPLRWDDARVVALLRERSLSAAGARLGVNASTASRRLTALEAALGTRLFDRTPDGVLPTAVALELAPHAEAMERAAAGLALMAQGRETRPEGEVRLSALPGMAEFLLAPALPRLFARYPRLGLVLDASVAYVDLTQREADLALRTRRPTKGDLIVRSLGESSGGFHGSPTYVKALGRLRHLSRRASSAGPRTSPTCPRPSSSPSVCPPRRSSSRRATWAPSSLRRARASGSSSSTDRWRARAGSAGLSRRGAPTGARAPLRRGELARRPAGPARGAARGRGVGLRPRGGERARAPERRPRLDPATPRWRGPGPRIRPSRSPRGAPRRRRRRWSRRWGWRRDRSFPPRPARARSG